MCASEKRTHKIIPFAPANFVVVASAVRREVLRNSRNTPNQGRAGQAYAWRSAGCSDEIRPQSKQRFASFCLGEMPEALPALQEIQNGGFSGFAEVVFLDPGASRAAPFAEASPIIR